MAVFRGVTADVEALEHVATDLRRRARVRDGEPALAPTIAMRLLGPRGLVFGHPDVLPHYDPTQERIVVPEQYPDLNFAVAHELAEVSFRRWSPLTFASHGAKESAANYVAAALLAPPEDVRAEAKRTPGNVARLSNLFGVSQSTMILRLAEVLGERRAVVTRKNNIHTRGVPVESIDLVAFAREARLRHPGLSKTALTGTRDAGRVAILASC